MPATRRQTGKQPEKAPKPLPAAKPPARKAATKPAKPPAKLNGKAAAPAAKVAKPTAKVAKAAVRLAPAPKGKGKSSTADPKAPPARAARTAPATGGRKVPTPASGAKSKAAGTRSSINVDFAIGKLHQVALLATDLDRSIAFYRDILGLGYMDRYDPPGLAFFNLGGGTRLILSATSSKATLYFRVDDIEAAVAALAARGVFFLHKPSMIHRDEKGRLGKKGVEEWMAFFKDPSDNVLALVAQR